MRLINTQTLEVELFASGSMVPAYAILSHTWGNDEVTLQDLASVDRSLYRAKIGYQKVEATCHQARNQGLQYAWIDTCCIDKTSSAELAEAINSMFLWYAFSETCYAYLSDVVYDSSESGVSFRKALETCRWFTRGWTLQELIAPNHVEFFDKKWTTVGDKSSLGPTLQEITGINLDVLQNKSHLRQISIAQRMSWASERRTTLAEDRAYSLLGIFDVHMPLLYGEGDNAFQRLQEEIARNSNDLSLFAWTTNSPEPQYRGIFAKSPEEFRFSNISIDEALAFSDIDFTISNRGIQMTSTLVGHIKGYYLFNLNCHISTIRSIMLQSIS
ncbi:HET-domain-containing protein [Zopfia rhizophila CBS 207.26]|uniref:HET-domain-containing protein n=1 Tax=Zopfia rhizophila CBS 207.26 TaxID=1314779 RepID=A0A6A6E407_9PEZI|nr:HET-domain-containing protein [Zopfia rhizophila CBS 207.26]